MTALLTIARAAVTEHLRRKVILFFAVIALLVAVGLTYLAVAGKSRSALGSALAGLGAATSVSLLPFTTTLAAVTVSMNNIGRPFFDGEAMPVLARPVARWQFAAGKLLASIAVVVGLCIFSALLLQGVGLLGPGGADPALWGYWAVTAFNLTILVALTTLASSIMRSPVLAAFIAYFIYSLSGVASALYLLVTDSQVSGAGAAIVRGFYYLTPRRLLPPSALGQPTAGQPGNGVRAAWAVAYLAVVLALTLAAVRKKEL